MKLHIFPYVYVLWTFYGPEWALKARDASTQILYLGATTLYIYIYIWQTLIFTVVCGKCDVWNDLSTYEFTYVFMFSNGLLSMSNMPIQDIVS